MKRVVDVDIRANILADEVPAAGKGQIRDKKVINSSGRHLSSSAVD